MKKILGTLVVLLIIFCICLIAENISLENDLNTKELDCYTSKDVQDKFIDSVIIDNNKVESKVVFVVDNNESNINGTIKVSRW